MSYLSEKDEWLWAKMQRKWLDEIINKEAWKNINDYNFKENNEWTIYDYEQSPLCQIIWGEILTDLFNDESKQSGGEYTYLINRTALTIKNKKESYRFLFDVMNNLKPKWSHDSNDNEYHFIGNFTPIPANNPKNKRSLQFIHRDFNENWDDMIVFLKKNWKDFKMNNLTFEKYIEFTYQCEYYCNGKFIVTNDIGKIREKIDNRGRKIQNKCSEIFSEYKTK